MTYKDVQISYNSISELKRIIHLLEKKGAIRRRHLYNFPVLPTMGFGIIHAGYNQVIVSKKAYTHVPIINFNQLKNFEKIIPRNFEVKLDDKLTITLNCCGIKFPWRDRLFPLTIISDISNNLNCLLNYQKKAKKLLT